MWTVLKFDKKNLSLLKKDLSDKLGKDFQIYIPKLIIQKYKNNKLVNKEFNLLGDYLFCFHKNFEKEDVIKQLKFLRGLKYFLSGFKEFQIDLKNFINKCKELENEKGFITGNLFEINEHSNYKFYSGPFVEKIFKIVNFNNNNLNILIGNIKTRINKKDFLFKPI